MSDTPIEESSAPNITELSRQPHILADSIDPRPTPSRGIAPLAVVSQDRPIWKHPVVVILLAALSVSFFALIVVVFSLVVVRDQRDDLQQDLTCRSSSAVVVDAATAEELAAIGVAQATTLDALGAVAEGDADRLRQMVLLFPSIKEQLNMTADQLVVAVEARQAAVLNC